MSIHKELHILKTDDHSEFALWEVAKSENTLIKKKQFSYLMVLFQTRLFVWVLQITWQIMDISVLF